MEIDLLNLFNALLGMALGVIGTLGVLWTLEPEKFKELMKAIKTPKKNS